MFPILLWWLGISFLGLIVTPITFKIFKFLPERGYAFNKALGLLMVGLLSWWLGFLVFNKLTIFLVFLGVSSFSVWLAIKNKQALLAFWQVKKDYIILTEGFFLTIYLLFVAFRMYNPDIVGTEKFMDMAFMNAISKAEIFPPYDPWLSGEKFFISYYYLGYLLMGILNKFIGTPPAIGFNLALSLLFAVSGITVFGFLYNLTKKVRVAIGGWGIIYLLGNLDGCKQLFTTHSIEKFNWWTPSRVIPNTINEFPFFSFLLGDMHPHMMSIPYVIIILGLALNHLKTEKEEILSPSRENFIRYAFWGLLMGSLGFMNSWDLPTAFFISGLAIFFQKYREIDKLKNMPWKKLAIVWGWILLFMFIPYIPFYINFNSQAQGLAVTTQNTKISEYLLIFGVYVFMVLTFMIARYHNWFIVLLQPVIKKKDKQTKKNLPAYCAKCGNSLKNAKNFCGQCGFKIKKQIPSNISYQNAEENVTEMPSSIKDFFLFILQPIIFLKKKTDYKLLIIIGLILVIILLSIFLKSKLLGILIFLGLAIFLLLLTKVDTSENILVLILLLAAYLLSFGSEVLHIKDTFGPPLDRMNTVFKFYYQTWYLMGLSGVYGVYWAFKKSFKNANLKILWFIPMVLLIVASLVYPYASIFVKTNHFNNIATLDGSYYLRNKYPEDREGIEWLRENVKNKAVILEATGGQYTDYARVSTFTGLPTVLGWAGHELQWRGNYHEPGKRIPDIDTLYSSTDINKVKRLLKKYNIEYVFVGTLERKKYSAPGLKKFGQCMQVVYSNSGVVIYKKN